MNLVTAVNAKPIIVNIKGTGFNPKLIATINEKNIQNCSHFAINIQGSALESLGILFTIVISTKLSRITIPERVFVTKLILIFIMFQSVDVAPKAR